MHAFLRLLVSVSGGLCARMLCGRASSMIIELEDRTTPTASCISGTAAAWLVLRPVHPLIYGHRSMPAFHPSDMCVCVCPAAEPRLSIQRPP